MYQYSWTVLVTASQLSFDHGFQALSEGPFPQVRARFRAVSGVLSGSHPNQALARGR